MVGGNACSGILVALMSRQSRSMTVHGLAITVGGHYLSHHLLVVSQHAGIVHHLTQEANILASHQLYRIFGVNYLAARLNITAYSRYTAGGTEKEIEVSFVSGANHVVDTLHAQYIANLVRVGNDANRSVADGDVCKLVRHHHAALNVHVAVNETRHHIRPALFTLRQLVPLHFYYLLVLNHQFTVIYFTVHHIDNMSFYTIHRMTFLVKWYILSILLQTFSFANIHYFSQLSFHYPKKVGFFFDIFQFVVGLVREIYYLCTQ